MLDIRTDVIDENGAIVSNKTIDELIISNSYQTTSKTIFFNNSSVIATSLSEISKYLIRKWRIWLLPDNPASEFYRFVDTHVKLKLIKDNSLITVGATQHSCKFTLHDLITYYRPVKN